MRGSEILITRLSEAQCIAIIHTRLYSSCTYVPYKLGRQPGIYLMRKVREDHQDHFRVNGRSPCSLNASIMLNSGRASKNIGRICIKRQLSIP